VRYDQLIEGMRPQLNAPELRSPWQNALRRLLLQVLPYPARLRALLQPLRLYAGTPLQALLRRSGLMRLLGPELEAMEALLPPLAPEGFADTFPVLSPARGQRRHRVGLVLGCVQRSFDPGVNRAVVEVLTANGIEVVIPPRQGCCGAVSHHQGALEQTAGLAADLVASFAAVVGPGKPAGPEPLEAVLVAASGCGHTLKAYDRLLPAGEGGFGVPVADVHEFLHRVGLSEAFRAGLQPLPHADGRRGSAADPVRLAYHDACHMIHGQGIREQPRALLRQIPHLRLLEAVEAGVCCGSAGIYNLVQPEEAAELGRLKVADLRSGAPDLIASANIGCTLQLRRHLGSDTGADAVPAVRHPLELLAASWQGAG
jgi:glycolate oxidase iron-sulfur subunit